jgi:hypothetical protein
MADIGSPSTTVIAASVLTPVITMPADGVVHAGAANITPVGHLRGTHQPVYTMRQRFTIAQVNAGATISSAMAGISYRMVDAKMIAIGGAVTQVTTVDILGTQAGSSVKLVAFAQASLTQSAVLKAGGTGAAVIADGVSFGLCDPNTAITVGITGGDITVATYIDVIFDYLLEV